MNESEGEAKITDHIKSMNESEVDEIDILANFLSNISMAMNMKPSNLDSLDRAKVQQFVKDCEEF